MENEYFVNHRNSTFVLGVEMQLKLFINIGCRICKSIRENDDGSLIASVRSFLAFARSRCSFTAGAELYGKRVFHQPQILHIPVRCGDAFKTAY
jgi:hypothetical protein